MARPVHIPQTGRILRWSGDESVKNRRGRLVVAPAPKGAIRVEVVNDLGGSILKIVARAAETTLVDLPHDSVPRELRGRCSPRPGSKLTTVPGALWFYAAGAELGFLLDANAGAYTAKFAVERPRDGNPFDNDESEVL